MNIGGLEPFLALRDIKTHTVSFGQRFEPLTLNFGMMNEHIISTLLLDKTKTLCIIEPLHCTFSHF